MTGHIYDLLVLFSFPADHGLCLAPLGSCSNQTDLLSATGLTKAALGPIVLCTSEGFITKTVGRRNVYSYSICAPFGMYVILFHHTADLCSVLLQGGEPSSSEEADSGADSEDK